MRFIPFLCICLAFVGEAQLSAEKLSLSVHAESAILLNAETGAILFEKNSRQLQYPASITKIATAIYTLHTHKEDLDTKITAEYDCVASISEEAKRRSNYTLPAHWLVPGSSHIGIKKGEELSLRDLLYGMMVASGDDAANVIAHYVSNGSIPDFVNGLNQYVKTLGCLSTNFCNPHGLHHPKQETTAYDMAILTKEALKNPFFREVTSTVRCTRPKTNKQEATTLIQTNKLLRKGAYYYPYAIGVKTGSGSPALNTFVGAANDGERTLIAVLLKVKEREDLWKDSIKLFEAAFNQPKVERIFFQEGKQSFQLNLEGAQQAVTTFLTQKISLSYYPAEEPLLKCQLVWDAVQLPIEKGQRVGELRLYNEKKEVVIQSPLLASETVLPKWTHKWKQLIVKSSWGWVLVLGIFLAAAALFFKSKK